VNSPKPLTAAEFFAPPGFAGFSKTNAQNATGLAYTTILDAVRKGKAARPETLRRLQEWSLNAIETHGVYISAAKTLGLEEPVVANDVTPRSA
jgi:hypothetical protein